MAENNVKIGISVDAKEAQKEFDKVGDTAKGIGDKAEKGADKAEKETKKSSKKIAKTWKSSIDDIMDKMDAWSSRFLGLNAAIELGQKAWGMLSGTLSTIGAHFERVRSVAIELRGEMNPLVQQFRELENKILNIDAAMGLVALSADTAIGSVMTNGMEKANKLFKENGGYLSELLADAKAIILILGTLVAYVGGGMAVALTSAISVLWNKVTKLIRESIALTTGSLAWIFKKLPGDWAGTVDKLSGVSKKFAKDAKGDAQDINDTYKLQKDTTDTLGQFFLDALSAFDGAGDAARGLHDANKEVTSLSEAMGAKEFTDFGIKIRKALDAGIKGFQRQDESLESTQKRLDGLRESVANLKEGFESQKIEFLNPEEIAKSAQALKDLLKNAGINIPIDINTLDARDQAEALVQVYTASEQKIGHASANMGRDIANNIALETEIAAKRTGKALAVDLAKNGVKVAQDAYASFVDRVKEANAALIQNAQDSAVSFAEIWLNAGVDLGEEFGAVMGKVITKAEDAEDALRAFALSATDAFLSALEDSIVNQITADATEAALHSQKLARVAEMGIAEQGLFAQRATLAEATIALESGVAGASVVSDTTQAASAASSATSIMGSEGQKTSAVIASAGANIGEAGTSVFKDVVGALGPFGIPVAVAIVGGMIAAIKGLVGEFMGAADGGLIVGGKRGKDSVPIMGMPGEYIMSVPEVEGVQKFMGAMGGSQRKSQEQQRAQTINNQITIEFKSDQLPNKLETKKWVKTTVLPALRQLQSAGY